MEETTKTLPPLDDILSSGVTAHLPHARAQPLLISHVASPRPVYRVDRAIHLAHRLAPQLGHGPPSQHAACDDIRLASDYLSLRRPPQRHQLACPPPSRAVAMEEEGERAQKGGGAHVLRQRVVREAHDAARERQPEIHQDYSRGQEA